MRVESPWVGRPMLRREDAPILRGAARYIDDLTLPGMLHMVMVRSPFAHARVSGIDTSAALAIPGVTAVVTGADLTGLVRPMPINPAEGADVAPVPIPLLATDRVRFTGEAVASVLAETRAAAEDAAELVAVDYDPLPVVVDPHEALRGAVTLHEDVVDNVLVRWRRVAGDVDGAFAASARVVRGRFHIPRIVAAPIETRGALASYDADGDLLTLWISSQDPHRPLSHLSAVLGRDRARIRMIVPEVGGAFGSKGTLAPEAGVAAIAAMKMGRPVKWIEDRSENFLASYQGRGPRRRRRAGRGRRGPVPGRSRTAGGRPRGLPLPHDPGGPGDLGHVGRGRLRDPRRRRGAAGGGDEHGADRTVPGSRPARRPRSSPNAWRTLRRPSSGWIPSRSDDGTSSRPNASRTPRRSVSPTTRGGTSGPSTESAS